ncbi:glyoxalase [Arthrobacter sp. SW1]|uniref:VOC family protein n=1 Tax=Arthrobacter sp. SW1 TaxID=1920889 RepID=UPI000877B05C|nr:VOC family protein [Arthrobacter sp. SW1]OFI38977.1 glyoxalase [Arthrobacter sp. SW1]
MENTEERIIRPRIASIMVNASDAESLAAFWSAVLELPVASRHGQFIWLEAPGPGAPQVAFQQVPEPSGGRRLHLDLHHPDPAGLRRRAESLGAVFVEGHDIGDFHWDVMQDPEGNEFCIAAD